MRVAICFVVALAACGGEGKCEFPPCDIPDHACRGDEDCFQTEFCNFQRNSCGTSELDRGVCDRRPARFESCDFDSSGRGLTCGCDGVFYSNECAANQAGTDVDNNGDCSLPAGAFSCGSQACLKDRHACFEIEGMGPGTQFTCELIPEPCKSSRTCACVSAFVGCSECTEVNGELRLKCNFAQPVPDGMATSSAAALRASTSASH